MMLLQRLRHPTATQPPPIEWLWLFLTISFYIVVAVGGWLRRDGTGAADSYEDARTLFLFGWTILPIVASILTLALAQRARRHALQVAIVFGLWGAALITITLGMFPAGEALNHIYSWVFIPAALLFVLLMGFALVQVPPLILRIIGGSAALVVVGSVVYSLTAHPLTITETIGDSHVQIQAERATLPPDESVRMTWEAEGIAAIYRDGTGTVGMGEANIQQSEFSPNGSTTFTIEFPDGTSREYTLIVQRIHRTVWLWLGGLAVGGVGLVWLIPRYATIIPPLLMTLAGLPFYRLGDLVPYPALLGGIVLAALWLALRRFIKVRPSGYLLDIVAVLIVVLYGVNLAFPSERYHQQFFLAPINDILHGKTVFIDTNAQYGILSSYILAALFKHTPLPLTPTGASILSGLLLVGMFAALYVMLRRLLHIRALALGGLLLMTLIVVIRGEVTPYTHMGLGGLRYGTLYLLALLVTLRITSPPQYQRRYLVLELMTTTYAVLWSLEAAAGTLALYLAVVVYEALVIDGTSRKKLKILTVRLGAAVMLGVLAFAAFNGFTWLRAGQFPIWEMYLNFYTLYSGVNDRFIDTWSLWVFVPLASYVALAGVLVRLATANPARLLRYLPVYAVAWIGVIQFFYWASIPLYSTIHAFTLPGLFALTFWLDDLLASQTERPLKWVVSGLSAAAFAVTILAVIFLPPTPLPTETVGTALAAGRLPQVKLAQPSPAHYTLWSMGRYPWATEQDLRLSDLLALIDRYAPQQERVPVLVAADTGVAAMLAADKTNAYLFSHPMMDIGYIDHIVSNPPDLRAGDIVFLQGNFVGFTHTQVYLYEQLEANFDFEWLTVAPSRVAAVRLMEKEN